MSVSASLTAPFSVHSRLILLAALLCLACSNLLAQATNPNYTADMPSVERVKAEIKGSDPTDTLARQVAVFVYLSQYIQRIKYNRDYFGPYTPDEQRVMGSYDLAAYQISQDYAKSHTPAEATAFERLHGQYEMNSDFYKDWSKRLIGKQSAAAYHGAESELGARQKAHYDKEMEDYKRDRAAQQAADKQIFGNKSGLSDDPTAVATRRCLELGGSSMACMGKGMGAGFMDLLGINMGELTGPGRAGVVLSGRYRNPATLASLDFGKDAVSIVDCGKLVADGHGYTIDKRPGSLRVNVENEPRPFVLTMRPDGGLAGPGPVDVKGRIIIGYHTVTSTLMINGVRAAPDQCNGPCQTVEQVPDYAPKIEHCTIGSLAAPQRPKPQPRQAAGGGEGGGLLGMLVGTLNTGEMTMPNEPGLRMAGQYGGGRLLMEFTPTSVVLDCGEAHVRDTYTVENTAEQLLVHVENAGGPLTLAVEPDNTLRGTGSTTVNGRLVTGMQGDNITFTPHSEHCEVASFRPKTGSAPATSVASATHAPAPAAAASVTPVSEASPATPAGMTLAITTSFPGGPNPLAGRVVQLTSERFDIMLRKVGVPIPADTTPGKALQAYSANCLPPRSCPTLATALHPYYVGKTTIDTTGKATLTAPVPPGSYFIFCSANTTNGGLVWDVPINLKAGDNTITLSAANAELVH